MSLEDITRESPCRLACQIEAALVLVDGPGRSQPASVASQAVVSSRPDRVQRKRAI